MTDRTREADVNNPAFLRAWARDIRKYSSRSEDADQLDDAAKEIEELRQLLAKARVKTETP